MKKILSIVVCLLLAANLFVGCAKDEPVVKDNGTVAKVKETTAETAKEETVATPKERPEIKFYGKIVEYTSGPMMTDALSEMVKDDYIIDAIQVDWGNRDQVIRTGIAAGDPADLYAYPMNRTINWVGMAVDLKPYLDADPEWAARFDPEVLKQGTFDGELLNLPFEQNFPMVLANKTALDELGIVIPDAWTIEEFSVVCEQIKAAGIYPFSNAMDHGRAAWLWRNAMLSMVVTNGLAAEYAADEVSLTGSESVAALEAVKSLYDNDFMYPGIGAVTVGGDEVKAGFYSGQVLMMPEIAAGAKQTAMVADFEVVAVPWPSAGAVGAINGVYGGLFIPSNSKNIDAAVEVLKAWTDPSIQAIHAEQGYIPATLTVEVTDPFVLGVKEEGATIGIETTIGVELNDYLQNGIIPDLILNGGVDAVIDALSALE